MPDPAAPVAFELVARAPSQRTAGLISGMTGYRETARGRFCQREAAPLAVPLIISFGTPFTIGLGREPEAADRQRSFAAGLYAGPSTSSPTAAPNACRWISRRSALSGFSAAPSSTSPRA